MNTRAGRYRHLQTEEKCLTYADVSIEFSREEYKAWCLSREQEILSLNRPSLDRKDKSKNYTIENIQVIELALNIRKDKTVFDDKSGRCFVCTEIKSIEEFCADKRRANGKTSICLSCENKRNKARYLASSTV